MIIALARSKDSMTSRSSMPRARACVIVSKLEAFNPLSGFRYRDAHRLVHGISRRKQGNIGELFYFEQLV